MPSRHRHFRLLKSKAVIRLGSVVCIVSIMIHSVSSGRAAILDHTVRGALSPPHTSRALGSAAQEGRYLRAVFEGCTRQPSGPRGNIGKLMREECREMQSGPKAKLLCPTNIDLAFLILRSDCHLPAMYWADKWLRSSAYNVGSKSASSLSTFQDEAYTLVLFCGSDPLP